jgi:hypothetical protein
MSTSSSSYTRGSRGLVIQDGLCGLRPTGHGDRIRARLVTFFLLKFNFHHINVPSNVWSTKCRLIACMSIQIRSNLRDESIKPN